MSFLRIAKLLSLLVALTLTGSAAEKEPSRNSQPPRYDKDALTITSTADSRQPVRYTGKSSNGESIAPDSEIRLPLDQVPTFSLTGTSLSFSPPSKKTKAGASR
jgi:hypothetical protein